MVSNYREANARRVCLLAFTGDLAWRESVERAWQPADRCVRETNERRVNPSTHTHAGVAELADALDSKSSDRKVVWVQVPPPVLLIQ